MSDLIAMQTLIEDAVGQNPQLLSSDGLINPALQNALGGFTPAVAEVQAPAQENFQFPVTPADLVPNGAPFEAIYETLKGVLTEAFEFYEQNGGALEALAQLQNEPGAEFRKGVEIDTSGPTQRMDIA